MLASSIILRYFFVFLFLKPDLNALIVQEPPEAAADNYPKGQFVFPIKPGSNASLSGSYGDIRFNHFHAGLDIRTGGVEGVPVHAADEGYVSRIGVSEGGYGNALYITHPNGFTTVYGHLKEFADGIKSKLIQVQYQKQSWEVDVDFHPEEIKVKKGEVVAFSGNTGGSGGPHLHFEIRNEAEETINPALFGFKEVVDHRSPVVEKVVLKPMDIDSRINGQYGEITLSPIRLKSGDYVLNNRITATGKVGVMLYTYDRSETSPFRLGVTNLNLTNNGANQYSFDLEKMVFDTKIDMNLHTDYGKMVENGQKYHKLYVEKGNRLNQYTTNSSSGLIVITEQKNDIEINISDTYQNTSVVKFSILREDSELTKETQSPPGFKPKILTDKFDNVLRIQAVSSTPVSCSAVLQLRGAPKTVKPAYTTANSVVYLYDLRKGLIDFVQVGESFEKVNLNVLVNPELNQVESENFDINFGKSLYSDLILNFCPDADQLVLDKDVYPLKSRFNVTWKTAKPICNKCGIYLDSSRPKFLPSNKTGGGVMFSPKELGTYRIIEDNEAPIIKPLKINSAELSFYIKDNLSGIKNISCFVDNEWVLMEYESKLNLIWAEKLHPKKPFTGTVRLVVEDNQGNIETLERKL